MPIAPRDHLALAADLPLREAEALYHALSPYVSCVKIGSSLFVEHGPEAVRAFLKRGARVFLDLKLHDIPNTVALAAEKAAQLSVSLITVHAQGGASMMRAAVEGARRGAQRKGVDPPKVLAVTILTSLDPSELAATGATQPVDALVAKLAGVAHTAGVQGLVCSPHEVAAMRAAWGAEFFLCTPGIRPAGGQQQDQSRFDTPAAAIAAGADLLVVGRPIYQAPDPVAAAKSICAEIASAKSAAKHSSR